MTIIKTSAPAGALAGALAGMVAATLAACTPATQAPLPEIDRSTDAVVARVDGSPVYLSDVALLALGQGVVDDPAAFTTATEGFADVREEAIDQRVFALEARREDLHLTDDARQRLALAEERMLGNLLVERRLADFVTETELGRLYDEQAALREPVPQRRASYLFADTEDGINEMRDRVEAGEAMLDVADGTDSTFDWFAVGDLPVELTDAAFATEPGNLSPPVQTDEGWYVLRVEEARDATPTFAQLRDELEAFLIYDTLEAYVADLRAGADVELVDAELVDAP